MGSRRDQVCGKQATLPFSGRPSTEKWQSALEFESQQYGDILQEDFQDSYRNLTHKTVMMLRWTTAQCPQARFVVKIDDDLLPNLGNFYRAMHGQTGGFCVFALRPSQCLQQCRHAKVVASTVLLTLVACIFFLGVVPLNYAIFTHTPLKWFPDPDIAKLSLPAERLHNKPYKYLLTPDGVCPKGAPIDYLFMVFSAPEYVEARNVCGNRLLFLFGRPSTEKWQSALEFESQQYGDILQEDFQDSYRNLTHKTVMMLRWTTAQCPQARFVVKIDDDCFPNLLNFYQAMLERPEEGVYGDVQHRVRPTRTPGHKWYISYDDLPRDVLPDFVSGGMYAIGGRVVDLLYRATGQVKFFHMEDIYLTGMCAERAGVARTHLVGTYNLKLSSLCEYKKSIYGHHVTPKELNDLWYAMKRIEYKCHQLLFGFYLCYCRTVTSAANR
ncbi:hypothetical protein HPB48_016933 [Haemaphysalis longicornis]|uniref:Hexosyltransferase n=1 Tax=Haemaphysalis longicornis TaxID=44386 RepID=A0A9J6G1B6_HAELO|nr:hypothetical protein HPB48_016933 [Haemaphysalis longicornis]